MLYPWGSAIFRIIAVAGAALALGWVAGLPRTAVFLALAAYLAWHVAQLARALAWLREGESQPPAPPGLWGELMAKLREVLERDRARERRLRALLREYQEFAAAMPDGTVALNEKREIIWLNGAAARLVRLEHPRDVGQRIDNLIRSPEFVEYLAGGDYGTPLELPSREGKVRLSLHVVPYGAGQMLLVFKDKTERVRLEKMRRHFVANASHELRSPLTVISGYLDSLVEDESLRQTWGAPLEDMQFQARRMDAIIKDLLELSRLEAASGVAQALEVDVAALLREVASGALSGRDNVPALDVEIESQANLLGTEHELHSAFSNLLNNAVKYTAADGKVQVRWYETEAGGHFEVVDSGIGIAERHLPRLTERFYRVDKGRARHDGGTGLGLAIVKHVLQRHEAELEVESEPGKGSTFICHFPSRRLVRTAASRQAHG